MMKDKRLAAMMDPRQMPFDSPTGSSWCHLFFGEHQPQTVIVVEVRWPR